MSEVLVRASRKFADLMEGDARAYLLVNERDSQVADLLRHYELLKAHLDEDQVLAALSEEYFATARHALELFLRKMFALLQRAGYFRRKVRGVLSKDAVASMQNWAELHGFVLPSAAQKQDLCRATGLNTLQVSNWFANAKARKWNKRARGESLPPAKRLHQSPPLEDDFAFADIFKEQDDLLLSDDYLVEWFDV